MLTLVRDKPLVTDVMGPVETALRSELAALSGTESAETAEVGTGNPGRGGAESGCEASPPPRVSGPPNTARSWPTPGADLDRRRAGVVASPNTYIGNETRH